MTLRCVAAFPGYSRGRGFDEATRFEFLETLSPDRRDGDPALARFALDPVNDKPAGAAGDGAARDRLLAAWRCLMARSRALDALRRRRTYAQYEISLDDVLQEAENSFHSAYDLTGGRQRSTIVRNLLSRSIPCSAR